MSWKPADIKAELNAMGILLQARPGVSDLQNKLLKAVKSKLQHLSVQSSSEWVMCYDAVKESNLPQAVAAEVREFLDQLAFASPQDQAATKLTSMAQECRTFHWYLTASDLAALQSSSMWEGCLTLTSRMRSLGIKGIKETLKKQCASLLVLHEFERTKKIPSPDTVYDVAQHLVNCMETSMVEIPANSVSLACYPDDPMLLPSSHLEAAYGQDKPAKKDFPQLSQIMKKHVWVRSSAAALTGKATGLKTQQV